MPIARMRITGDVVDSAWVNLFAEFRVKWSDGTVHPLEYALASGSVSELDPDPFDFADGTRELSDIDSLHLKVTPATGTPYGRVDWDCLRLENVRVKYTLGAAPDVWENIDVRQPQSLVPNPTGEKTNCSGLPSVRLY